MISEENRIERAFSRRTLVIAVALAMSAYHLWTGYFGAAIPEVHYPIHLLFVLAIVFLNTYRRDASRIGQILGAIYDAVLLAIAAACTGYLFLNAEYLTTRMALFDPVTTVEYVLPERTHVTIEVFNILGQKVRTLVDREEPAGPHSIVWDGTDASGNSVATGLYLYRVQTPDHAETRKMLLLK